MVRGRTSRVSFASHRAGVEQRTVTIPNSESISLSSFEHAAWTWSALKNLWSRPRFCILRPPPPSVIGRDRTRAASTHLFEIRRLCSRIALRPCINWSRSDTPSCVLASCASVSTSSNLDTLLLTARRRSWFSPVYHRDHRSAIGGLDQEERERTS